MRWVSALKSGAASGISSSSLAFSESPSPKKDTERAGLEASSGVAEAIVEVSVVLSDVEAGVAEPGAAAAVEAATRPEFLRRTGWDEASLALNV